MARRDVAEGVASQGTRRYLVCFLRRTCMARQKEVSNMYPMLHVSRNLDCCINMPRPLPQLFMCFKSFELIFYEGNFNKFMKGSSENTPCLDCSCYEENFDMP